MKKQVKVLKFKVLIEQDEDGWYVASVPAIPGCHTQGKTYEEAIKNIKEAIELCLEVAEEDKNYSKKIHWNEVKDEKSRFISISEIPIKLKLGFS